MIPGVAASQPQPEGAEFSKAIEECLSRYYGVRRSLAAFSRAPSPYRTSFAIEDVEVRFEDGTLLKLVFKDLSPSALAEESRLVKPVFVYDPLREIEIYEAALSRGDLGTASFYGSVVEVNRDRYWLFMEKIRGVGLYEVGELAVWKEAARWLARMHSQFTIESGRLAKLSHLLHYNADFYRRWMRRARTFLSSNAQIHWLAKRYDLALERLVDIPQALIHGEFYASNVLVRETTGQVCPIDWEMAGIGPALIDLAALSAGKWNCEEREKIALAYWNEIQERNGPIPLLDTFLEWVESCRLHLCVQWLGWAQSWSAPREHAQDWLKEAILAAEKLGL